MEIMNAALSRFVPFSGLFCCLTLVDATGLFASDLVFQKVPPLTVVEAPAYPENLARYHFGAQVLASPRSHPIASLQLSRNSEDNNVAEAALLCDDPTIGYALTNGKASLLVSLAKIENIDNVSFLNTGVKGEVTVAISNAELSSSSVQWHEVARQEITSDFFQAKIGPTDAKYLRLTFDVTEPGRIAGFGVYSTPTMADFTMPRVRKVVADSSASLISADLADVHGKARALYVSSGTEPNQANKMIDGQPATSYTFGPDDHAPAAIIDLGKTVSVSRISAIYSARAGMMDFYVLQSLPGTTTTNRATAPKSLHFTEAALAGVRPVGSVADKGTGRVAIDFPAVAGRYIMVKWNPVTQQDGAFSIAEVAAFSGTVSRGLIAANISATEADGKDVKDFGEGKEAKEMPEEGPPAEGPPPSLPQPPPFVFVPEIVPTSP
jgi:hypothetical protein